MSEHIRYAYPKIGRAGLGNELFPFFRALQYSQENSVRILPAKWFKLRVGPYIRRESDKRNYWLIFTPPKSVDRIQRAWAFTVHRRRVHICEGMGSLFTDLHLPASWYLEALRGSIRSSLVPKDLPDEYVSAHVRLGDFARVTTDFNGHERDNQSTPVEWYVRTLKRFREDHPRMPILISSDGSDAELAPIFAITGVNRTNARSAVTEMLILAGARGLVGSRSTFTAWGAFLGSVPLFVAKGGNAYKPHDLVWEDDMESDEAPSSSYHSWLEACKAL